MSGPAADLAAVIAELAELLPAGHLAAWARVLRTIPADDLPTSAFALEAALIDARPGVALGGAAERLVAAWQTAVPPLSGAAVALALESAGEVAMRAASRRSDIVISGAVSDSEAIRLTGSVISELIHDCRESLLIVSFAAFGVTEVVQELARAVRRGVQIDLVLETTAEEGGAFARAGWSGRRLPGHPAGCDVLDLAWCPAAGHRRLAGGAARQAGRGEPAGRVARQRQSHR